MALSYLSLPWAFTWGRTGARGAVGSRRRGGGAGSAATSASGSACASAVVRSSLYRSLAAESRRSHLGMSTPAQMATMAT